MDQFDRDSTIADFKNGVTNLMVRVMTSNTVVKLQRIKERMEGITNKKDQKRSDDDMSHRGKFSNFPQFLSYLHCFPGKSLVRPRKH